MPESSRVSVNPASQVPQTTRTLNFGGLRFAFVDHRPDPFALRYFDVVLLVTDDVVEVLKDRTAVLRPDPDTSPTVDSALAAAYSAAVTENNGHVLLDLARFLDERRPRQGGSAPENVR